MIAIAIVILFSWKYEHAAIMGIVSFNLWIYIIIIIIKIYNKNYNIYNN